MSNKHYITYNDKKIYYYINSKDIKNINLKVNSDKKVVISIPLSIDDIEAKKIIKKKADWINGKLKYYDEFINIKENISFENGEPVYLLGKQYKMKILKNEINDVNIKGKYFEILVKEKYMDNKKYISNIYNNWIKDFSYKKFQSITNEYCIKLNKNAVTNPTIEVRNMKSRWGSCIRESNKVLYNTKLIKAPSFCIEYVVLHELSHFKYKNHNKDFYDFMTIYMPDWKERKKILDEEFAGVI